MNIWAVTDHAGREIDLTQERWDHILSGHFELNGHANEVLETIRLGRRKQSERDPQTYLYLRRVLGLPAPYDRIIVVVAFRFRTAPGSDEQVPNNFVVTAWGSASTLEDI